MTNLALLVAGVIMGVASLIHSWLGERRLIGPLLSAEHRSGPLAERPAARQVFRLAWHLTSLAWLAIGAILVALALSPPARLGESVLLIIVALLWLNGLTFVFGVGVRHIASPLFVAAAIAATVALF